MQPSRRLLLNYGIVDEGNPWDRIALTVRADVPPQPASEHGRPCSCGGARQLLCPLPSFTPPFTSLPFNRIVNKKKINKSKRERRGI